jgi:16S rRNA (uracil1498-N3)-methyltransferase
MRIPRVYVDKPLAVGRKVHLDSRAHHYLVKVLRLRTGAGVMLFNGQGGEFAATLTQASHHESNTATINAFLSSDREPFLEIELWQGIAKSARMDYVVQKAVELGVKRIQPLMTRYGVKERTDWRYKMAHWQRVIVSACEQSGRTRIPQLKPPQSLSACPPLGEDTVGLVLDPEARQGLHSIKQTPRRLILIVGPEGGLTNQELQRAQDMRFERVRMGPRTLRTETAATAALAAAQLLWGDLN